MENITIKDKLGIICSVCKDVILDDNDTAASWKIIEFSPECIKTEM